MIATTGFTYAYVATVPIAHVPEQPDVGRVADERADQHEVERTRAATAPTTPPGSSDSSPASTSPSGRSSSPPASISIGGGDEGVARQRQPRGEERAGGPDRAPSRGRARSRRCSSRPLGRTSSAIPPNPVATPSRAARAGGPRWPCAAARSRAGPTRSGARPGRSGRRARRRRASRSPRAGARPRAPPSRARPGRPGTGAAPRRTTTQPAEQGSGERETGRRPRTPAGSSRRRARSRGTSSPRSRRRPRARARRAGVIASRSAPPRRRAARGRARRDQASATCSTPNQPKRSIAVARENWPTIRKAVVATIPIRGPATVIARTITTLMSPPSSIHFGPAKPPRRPSRLRRATRSTASAVTPPMTTAQASASRLPIRSPSRPCTATWTAPPSPATNANDAATPVEPIPVTRTVSPLAVAVAPRSPARAVRR